MASETGRRRPRAELSPEAQALNDRAVWGRGRTGVILKMRALLDLPSVVEKADGAEDLYVRAVALEELLIQVVADLDRTFPYRRADESPTWIARVLPQFEVGEEPNSKLRRAKVARRYGWNADDLRHRYEKDLWEHIATELRTRRFPRDLEPPDDPDDLYLREEVLGAEDLAFPEWVTHLQFVVEDFYMQLDRGLHMPGLHNADQPVTTVDLLDSYARFLRRYEQGQAITGGFVAGTRDATLRQQADAIYTATLLDARDRTRLINEVVKKTDSDDFAEFLVRRVRGREILSRWQAWLFSCRCVLPPIKPPAEVAKQCTVHYCLQCCEAFLASASDDFCPGWRWRQTDPVYYEAWEASTRRWREADARS